QRRNDLDSMPASAGFEHRATPSSGLCGPLASASDDASFPRIGRTRTLAPHAIQVQALHPTTSTPTVRYREPVRNSHKAQCRTPSDAGGNTTGTFVPAYGAFGTGAGMRLRPLSQGQPRPAVSRPAIDRSMRTPKRQRFAANNRV